MGSRATVCIRPSEEGRAISEFPLSVPVKALSEHGLEEQYVYTDLIQGSS